MAGRVVGIRPNKEMAVSARNGLNLYQEYGRGESKRRLELADRIANQDELTPGEWRSIACFHARYYGNEDPSIAITYPDGGPDARYIASEMLGGDAGQEMSMEVVPKLNQQRRRLQSQTN